MSSSDDRREQASRVLQDALSRLVAGNPSRVSPGYRISVKAVCEEENLSRKTFYKQYRAFEEKIKAAAAEVGRPKVSRSRRRELEVRAENENLKMQVQALFDQNGTLLHRVEVAEKRLQDLRGREKIVALPDAKLRNG